MVRRALSIILLAWALGFIWFAALLPQPAAAGKSDAAVVLTGGKGRIDRGLEALERGWTERLLVSGVAREVKPHEFAAEYKVSPGLMACCITLGYEAEDTRSNARETAAWIARHKAGSLRLVTSDWHMRRAAMELRGAAPAGVTIFEDAVPTQPSLRILFIEYHKLIARFFARLVGG
jgi:uncharacterized SAM-binding protein YcdF (DUF218 family)